MKYYSALAKRLTPYTAGEQPSGGFIKLNTNENPYPPSPKAREAMQRAASLGEDMRLYPDPSAAALRVALAGLHGCGPENVFVSNGSDEALAFAFAAFFAEGECATSEIGYSFYPSYAKLFSVNLRLTPVSASPSTLFEADADALVREDTHVIIANPNAPTSLRLTRGVMLEMAGTLQRRGHVLIVDEAYAAFSDCQVADACPAYDNLLVIRTLSKSHSLAGLRVGYAVGSAELIRALEITRDSFNSYTVSRVAQEMATAAVLDSAYFEETTARVKATRERFQNELRKLGFSGPASQTNFLFVKHPRMSGEAFYAYMKERGVLVRYFNKPRLSDYTRITIGTDEQMDAVLNIIIDTI